MTEQSEERVIDIRGEPCGMPVLRVEKFMREQAGRRPFIVLGDHPQTMESLRLLAARYGWSCALDRDAGGNWRARFELLP